MAKRKSSKKTASVKLRSSEGKSGKIYESKHAPAAFEVQEAQMGSGVSQFGRPATSFSVTRGGKRRDYKIKTGFGYFIPALRKAGNLVQVNAVVEEGMRSKEVEPIIRYLDLKVPQIARAAAVSPSTVSRWKADTSIGVSGSNQFFRIDEVIRKGVELFGGLDELRGWLQAPNLALGSAVPADLITSHIGVEMVEEALDALHYGNVM